MIRHLISMLALLALVASAQATDQVVTDPADNGGPNQLRSKITAAQSTEGGTITFNVGTATIVLNQILPTITSNITIDGGSVVTISGNDTTSAFQLTSGAALTLNNLTITNCANFNGDGGAIRNGSSNSYGTLNITNCRFVNNATAASFSGGAVLSYGPLNITNSEFSSNSAGSGGAIYPRFSAAVTNINGCTFQDNFTTSSSSGWGAAMLLWDGAPVTVTNTTFSNNRARLGGAAAVTLNSSLIIMGSTLQTNSAVLAGGAIHVFADGQATIQNTSLVSNKIPTTTGAGPPDNGGGAISSKGTTSVIDCVLSQNVVTLFDGGAILVGGGTFNLTRSRLEGNRAANGGGLQVNGVSSTNITASTIRFNFTTGLGYGGGLAPNFFMASMNVADSTINNNSANYGAGISNAGSLTVTNCTISGNQAANYGGGIYNSANDGFPTARFVNSTFFGNGAATGGTIYELAGDFGGSVVLKNTIMAKSTNGGNLARANPTGGTIASDGYNLCDDNTCIAFLGAAGDKSGSQFDAKLSPLADNGGFTQTHVPQNGSAALDSGTGNGAPASDQRGLIRPSDDPMIPDASGGNGSDIGAVEVQVPPPSPTPTATPTTLANISTRLPVQTGDNALIGGFIITGTQPKKVIIRAIGPSLSLAGVLADPTLELYQGDTVLETNDNWMDSPNKQAIIDSTVPPSNNLESAIVRTLSANGTNYTAIVRGVNNGTGIGVVEAYDLDRSVDSKLANISTRGFVQTGDSVLIAGTIIVGQASQKVIIRAIGPSLSLPGKLADPTLQLVDGNGAILEENDNWIDSPNKQAIIDSTIPPSDDKESAIVRTLPANGAQYTAIVRGVGDTTGIAVVEVYALN
jgi:hypothetical protein